MNDERKYSVRHYRDGDKERVWVGDEKGDPNIGFLGFGFSRNVSLKWRWWHHNSPATRLAHTIEKAERYAERLNKAEMYMNHERQIGTRP